MCIFSEEQSTSYFLVLMPIIPSCRTISESMATSLSSASGLIDPLDDKICSYPLENACKIERNSKYSVLLIRNLSDSIFKFML